MTPEVPYPRPEAWNRFETYARRVRTLIFDVEPTTGDTFPIKTFQTVVQFRPPGKDLLPNLRKLTYNGHELPPVDVLSTLLPCLGVSVVQLELLGVASQAGSDLLGYLPHRAPRVQDILIRGSQFTAAAYTAISRALSSSMVQLEELTSLQAMGAAALTPAIWDAMAQHPSLVSAEFTLLPLVDVAGRFQPRIFTNLASLSCRAPFNVLCALFASQNNLPIITRISLYGISEKEGRSDFHQLCELLAQKLPNLACVTLVCLSAAGRENTPLKFEDFQSLLHCKKIQHFRLEHPRGVSVTNSGISELLDAWSDIDTLALQYMKNGNRARFGVYDLEWTSPTLPLRVLDTVAAKAPRIKELRLVFDATEPIDSTPGPSQQQFECLQELEVTLSTVRQPGNVASYLSQRCKKRFSLKFVRPLWHAQEGTARAVNGEKKKWDQVEEYLTLLFDQKERLEEEFKRRLEERAEYMRK